MANGDWRSRATIVSPPSNQPSGEQQQSGWRSKATIVSPAIMQQPEVPQNLDAQIARGAAEIPLRALEFPSMIAHPFERALGRKNEGPINLPGRQIELEQQNQVLEKMRQGQRPSLEELHSLSDEDILPQPTRRTSSSVVRELQEAQNVPKGGAVQEGVARIGNALPFAAGGPTTFLGALGSEQAGNAARATAKELGASEGQQLAADIGGGLGKDIWKLGKGTVQAVKKLATKTEEKLASGLTKPRAVEAKYPTMARIPKELQKDKIKKLNEEASKLTSKVLEKEKPILKQIKEGVNFDKKFEEGFGQIRQTAAKFNPDIDTKPIKDFMRNTREELSGINKPSSQSQKILKETEVFFPKKVFNRRTHKWEISPNHRPAAANLYDNLKTYRENNKKMRDIYEKSKLLGTQSHYVKFLEDYNKSIKDSMKKTLPEGSPWLKKFDEINKQYSEFLNAKKAEALLEPVLGKRITSRQVEKLAEDQKLQRKLALHLGQKGSEEVVQIAKDLKLARESIKNIPVKALTGFEEVLPAAYILSDFIPFGGVARKFAGFKYGKKAAQDVYGYYLAQPSTRRAYGDALKAFNNGDKEAFGLAIHRLVKEEEKD